MLKVGDTVGIVEIEGVSVVTDVDSVYVYVGGFKFPHGSNKIYLVKSLQEDMSVKKDLEIRVVQALEYDGMLFRTENDIEEYKVALLIDGIYTELNDRVVRYAVDASVVNELISEHGSYFVTQALKRFYNKPETGYCTDCSNTGN